MGRPGGSPDGVDVPGGPVVSDRTLSGRTSPRETYRIKRRLKGIIDVETEPRGISAETGRRVGPPGTDVQTGGSRGGTTDESRPVKETGGTGVRHTSGGACDPPFGVRFRRESDPGRDSGCPWSRLGFCSSLLPVSTERQADWSTAGPNRCG